MTKTQYDIDKAYVSPYDEFLFKFDATHPKTASQNREIKKHERIAQLRDNPASDKEEQAVWENF